MNKFFSNLLTATALSFAFAAVLTSCKKKFDEPPVEAPVTTIKANTTIAQLKARHTVSGAFDPINDAGDIIIRGIVIGDDRSGNLYKTMVIQDSTGGIAVLVDLNNFYNVYPIGREVFIKCNGLVLSDYANQIQLGGGIVTGTAPALADIPAARINNYIFKGTLGNTVNPAVVTASQLGTTMQDKYINTLVRLNNYEFGTADTSKTYASAGVASPSAVSYDLFTCASLNLPSSNSNIELRTSNYCNFAASPLPNGNGSITAIYTIFRTFKQLTIRDTTDVKCWGPRCGTSTGGGGGGGGTGTLSDISAIRALFAGGTTTVPSNTKITGIVISDRPNGNTQSQNIIIQQGNNLSGIVVRWASATPAHNFNVGDSIDINVSGGTLSLFSGVLQIGAVPLANATLISTGKVITPRTATIAQVNSNVSAWESTLVRMQNVTISSTAGANWGGTVKFTDASGSIDHFTRTGTTGATFANTAFPTGSRPSITAIVSKFNTTNQVNIRNPALDVQ